MRRAEEPPVVGEVVSIDERVVVSPANGRFHPSARVAVGDFVSAEISLGHVGGEPVTSPFEGVLMGFRSLPGSRVSRGDALAWLRPGTGTVVVFDDAVADREVRTQGDVAVLDPAERAASARHLLFGGAPVARTGADDR
jgi:hypothetical protein